jgi:hypothetical protein
LSHLHVEYNREHKNKAKNQFSIDVFPKKEGWEALRFEVDPFMPVTSG